MGMRLPTGLPILGHDMHVKAQANAAHGGVKAYAMPLTSFRKIMSKSCYGCAKTRLRLPMGLPWHANPRPWHA